MLVPMQEQVQQGQMQQRRPPATTWNQDNNLIAGKTTQTAQQQQFIQQGRPPDYRITIPALLPGPRCLTDASIATDQTTAPHRAAGLGVLIINTQTNQTQTITIQDSIDTVSSVIMAEAAAMALAARIARALGLKQANYLTDNQLLVNFFNSNSLSMPPDRRKKPLTQDFIHSLEANQIKVYKIAREINITAHSLAKQAHRLLSQPPSSQPVFSCTNLAHVHQCPVKNALACVNMSPFWLHTVRCA
jgi:ribonuclease HI